VPYQLEHRTTKTITRGTHYPLGATPTPTGVNFALYSQHATDVFLLLFDKADGDPTDIIRLEERDRFVWHALVEGVNAGQLYGYKVRGEYRPEWGLRFNDAKLLLDPYAKAVSGKFRNTDNLLLAYDPQPGAGEGVQDRRDNTAIVPKGIVIDDGFDWQGTTSPDLQLEQLLIYEVHVKGFTAHPSSGVKDRGTYLGFIEKIPYLKKLGINAVELLPVHECYVDDFLREKGLTNYWGYNSVGFFAPESSYSTRKTPGCQVAEFKTLVRELHKAGIKVILDVVYNHTGEGNEMGPSLCFRGTDNVVYYSLTGLLNSWTNLPALNTTASANGRTNMSATLNLNWAIGASLFLLWVDDNSSSPNTDAANQIDNFSLRVTPALACALTGPTNNAAFASGAPIPLAATATPSRTRPQAVGPSNRDHFRPRKASADVAAAAGAGATGAVKVGDGRQISPPTVPPMAPNAICSRGNP